MNLALSEIFVINSEADLYKYMGSSVITSVFAMSKVQSYASLI